MIKVSGSHFSTLAKIHQQQQPEATRSKPCEKRDSVSRWNDICQLEQKHSPNFQFLSCSNWVKQIKKKNAIGKERKKRRKNERDKKKKKKRMSHRRKRK
ncbi:hypothetical protein CEXT_744241 [Caerostris extrusa]|uniref:Mitochondrial mRNA-processing protein COX24 C-terminal domain-containing protein n=1 Tax=Caerostris extrusa TaxID=172846 RepID=A0AAV4Q807_CAEEX|nr:hypothetical protein CEXT_744241 [Caerostris extrusa]